MTAFSALSSLGSRGPAGWLREAWKKWHQEQPKLSERCNQHKLEILAEEKENANTAYFGSPESDDEELSFNPFEPQSSGYLYGYLLCQLTESEEVEPGRDQSWRLTWDNFLKKEMERGRSSTYQACLNLRYWLWKSNQRKCQEIADQLMVAISTEDRQQAQALIVIANIFFEASIREDVDSTEDDNISWEDNWKDKWAKYLEAQWKELKKRLWLSKQLVGLRIQRFFSSNKKRFPGSLVKLFQLNSNNYDSDSDGEPTLLYMPYRNLAGVKEENAGVFVLVQGLEEKMRALLKREKIVESVCEELKRLTILFPYELLVSLYCVIKTFKFIPLSLRELVKECVQGYKGRFDSLPIEQLRLVTYILQTLDDPSTYEETPATRVRFLELTSQKEKITGPQVQELLTACNDVRQYRGRISWLRPAQASSGVGLILPRRRYAIRSWIVQEIAWRMLTQGFNFEEDAYALLLQALENNDVLTCGAAARLFQYNKALSQQVREKAAQKIVTILRDDELASRPLNVEGFIYSYSYTLDGVLFEALKAITE